MAFRILVSTEGKSKAEKITRILGLSLLVFLLLIAGSIACKKEAGEGLAPEEGDVAVKEAINEFEGTAKVGLGRYLFIPAARGFDIIIQGQMELGDASTIVGKEVRGKGEFSPERPSILVVNSIEVKESERDWRNVFTRTEEFVIDDYLDLKAREEFQVLKDLSYNKKEGWEGIERAKIFGKLEKETVTEGEEQKDIYRIIVFDERGKEAGKIIVDSFTDFALYYMKKLKLFDNFWIYISIKDTVDWKIRQKTRELFHADVLFSGLF